MKIDLIYNYRAIDTSYIIYGPEKNGSNIEVSTEGYIVNSISEVINKINSMVASLAPDITNCQSISSGLYGNMYMQTWRGDLNAGSEVPDYTQVLTNINTNLTDLNNKFKAGTNNVVNITQMLQILAGCFTSNPSNSDNAFNKSVMRFLGCFSEASLNDNSNNVQSYSYLRQLFGITSGANNQTASQIRSASYIRAISQLLQQSVSPNASITDVISALNSNIHNDLTNINTTENNKDTVLIIDGQQEFKLHKDDE